MGIMNIQLEVQGVVIERVGENKFLGVIIDDKLNWKPHIRHVHSKVSRSVGVLSKAKYLVDYDSMKILYFALVLPYLSYCSEIWGNNYKSSIHSLFLLQKRAIRIIHKVGYREHTNTLFCRSKIMKHKELIDFQTAQILFKAKN